MSDSNETQERKNIAPTYEALQERARELTAQLEAEGPPVPPIFLTKEELKVLARYWYTERLEGQFDWFLYNTTGSRQSTIYLHSGMRLRQIRNAIGEDELKRIVDEIDAAKEKELGPGFWDAFIHGEDLPEKYWKALYEESNPEQCKRVQAEVEAELLAKANARNVAKAQSEAEASKPQGEQ